MTQDAETEVPELEQVEPAEVEIEGEQPEVEQVEQEDPDEVQVTIGEPAEAEDDDRKPAPEWLRELRESNRAKERRIRELEKQLNASQKTDEPVELGSEPDMADPDIDFDKDVFKQRWNAWHAKKQAVEAKQRERQEVERKAQEAYQVKLDAYNKAKAELKVNDYEDAEGLARDTFSNPQQSILVKYATNAAALIYALGKSPAKAKELAAITDPIEFALAARELEKQVKVTPKKVAPPPERAIRGSAAVASGTYEKRLEELRAEAVKTGDMSKVMDFKRQHKKS